ncbi:hypothetical protein [Erythrobacter alti]|uniref:hypothetical protein n=1 Tax=Erythrobacter alti TaxID=1896145 RepID=UPI0030F3E46F
MEIRRSGKRGGALMMLGGIIAIWALVRIALWQPPFLPASLENLPFAQASSSTPIADTSQANAANEATPAEQADPYYEPALPSWQTPLPPAPLPLPSQVHTSLNAQPAVYRDFGASRLALSRRGFAGAGNLVAHAYLLSAGYRSGSGPAMSGTNSGPQAVYVPEAAAPLQQTRGTSRWAMDAWALWRQDNDSPLLTGRPSYGRSQVGAVMRYRLAPSSRHAPQMHLRASAALEGRRERELALGISARPVPPIPVRLAAEARVSETERRTEPRAAAYAVTEFPPLDLPGGLTGEAYLQGGYVSGDFATPFVDGQARITRDLAETQDFRLSAGAGAWGGAQEDAKRLDIGPSAAVSFSVGQARGRVSADYRFRVAGDAQPASGPALTLSAGF